MIIRLIVEAVSAMAVAATVVSGLTLVITLVVAVAARRLAKAGAAGGRLIHRPRRSTAGSQRNEAISASEDARDEAAAVIQDVDPETREAVAHAYRAAVAEVAARRVLPARTLKQLSPDDWLAARYAVDV
jgi:type IV secretory pathway TrbL component